MLIPLGPFGPESRLAVAVSGGADSTALALLAAGWTGTRGGSVLALVVDHGLRPESGAEAALALRRLAERGIPGRLLPIAGLDRGPALAERARRARYAALEQACRKAGIVHLMLG
ncbi:MAG: tRNA lysidine(34) synthetase TilS, partial [Alphaproteobacteria bacterium]|nr:tRNA lysidine(34) synthetase TilS [Alphaproteobacteria bacterium]